MFDTHAHLDQDDFDPDRGAVITRAREAGVGGIVLVGCTLASSRRSLELAREFGQYAAVGVQPNYVAQATEDDWRAIVELTADARVVALGETGLDRYWRDTPFDLQQEWFDRHLRQSQMSGLPVVIHMRDCDADILTMLVEARRRGPVSGVMHSFTGSAETAEACLGLGLYLSFAGMVTYKKSSELRAIAASVPLDRLLVETDSPYLSPEPVRKLRRNEPAHVVHTVAAIAAARGESVDVVAAATTANARRLFRLVAC